MRPKKGPRVDRNSKVLIDGMSYISEVKVLERHTLWIAGDRQKTAAAVFFTPGGWGVYQLQGELTADWLIGYTGYHGNQ